MDDHQDDTTAAIGEFAGLNDGIAPKRQRVFIARQACEKCRQKKSRCDGDHPCGQCQRTGANCVFAGRKASRNEVSLGMVFNALQRIERKVETARCNAPGFQSLGVTRFQSLSQDGSSTGGSPHQPKDDERYNDTIHSRVVPRVASVDGLLSESTRQRPTIAYAIRQVLLWPAIRTMLGGDGVNYRFNPSYATLLEHQRPPLPPHQRPSGDDETARFGISMVKGLADSYFDSFNLGNPILDRKLFWQHTIGMTISSDFGYNIETCVVLVVMALGALGQRAFAEGGFARDGNEIPDDRGTEGGVPGLAHFNEARKRIGFIICENSIHSCQFYLLSGLFYSYLIRPVDWWAMVNRASLCCTSFWESVPHDCDQWTLDMQSRLFWNTAMFEAVLTQELDLPISNLLDYEEKVPLPRFVEYPSLAVVPLIDSSREEQDALCQYHFLSQIAHRIILTRLRNTMFAAPVNSSTAMPLLEDYPTRALEDELTHQFDQWRQKLPPSLQWDDRELTPVAKTPANVILVPFLRSRYHIARYHLRRPLFHRAIHYPDSMTDTDLEKCQDALRGMSNWIELMQVTLIMRSCLPLKFFICTQLLGMVLILEGLGRSADVRISHLVPAEYDSWRLFALEMLKECAPYSPTVAKDYEIITRLVSPS